jgi:hypothetical protein
MKTLGIIVVALGICGGIAPAHAASASRPVRVYVDCTNHDDMVGTRFCLALKEKIRASQGFELVESETPLVFEVHIVSESDAASAEEQGISAAASIVFTVMRYDKTESYLTSFVIDFGSARVNEEAEAVLGHIDEESDFLRRSK